MIDTEAFQEKIKAVLQNDMSSQLFLVLKEEDKFVIKKANMNDKKTENAIKTMFVENINNSVVLNKDLLIRNLSIAESLPNTLYLYDFDEFPEELEIFRNFNIKHAVSLKFFDFNKDSLKNIFGYIVYIGNMQDGISLFKKHYPISLIQRETFLLGVIKSKNRFEKIDVDDMIKLNGTVQLLKINNEIYIFDLDVLEKNMGFTQLIYKNATESIAAIENLDIVDDIQTLKDTLEDFHFVRKISKIKTTSPIFKLNISKDVIISFTQKTKELSGKFRYNQDKTKIILNTKKSKDAFIKLMNDSFLRSELTEQYYEALAKDKLV